MSELGGIYAYDEHPIYIYILSCYAYVRDDMMLTASTNVLVPRGNLQSRDKRLQA
jgi:hypothetical protein